MRQISGLGGGASSLSKCAVVSAPSDDWQRLARIAGHPFPGVSWAENFERASDSKTGWGESLCRVRQVREQQD